MSLAPARTYVGADAGLLPLQRTKVVSWPNVATRVLAFSAIAVITHFAFSLSGQVLLEQTRRESATVSLQLSQTQRVETALRTEVDALTNFGSIKEWALANGFVASEPVAEPSKGWFRVAARIP